MTISRQNNSPKYIITSELEFKESVKQISCGKDHNLILTPGGQIYSWGIGRLLCISLILYEFDTGML